MLLSTHRYSWYTVRKICIESRCAFSIRSRLTDGVKSPYMYMKQVCARVWKKKNGTKNHIDCSIGSWFGLTLQKHSFTLVSFPLHHLFRWLFVLSHQNTDWIVVNLLWADYKYKLCDECIQHCNAYSHQKLNYHLARTQFNWSLSFIWSHSLHSVKWVNIPCGLP